MVFNSRRSFLRQISRKLDSIFAGARDEANHRNRLEKPEGGPFARSLARARVYFIFKKRCSNYTLLGPSLLCVHHIESESNGGSLRSK